MVRANYDYFVQKFLEPFLACLLCMVQGDLTVLTLSHFITASKTAVIALVLTVMLSLFNINHSKWFALALTGFATFVADILSHPSRYDGIYTESMLTAGAAMLLALMFDRIFRRYV